MQEQRLNIYVKELSKYYTEELKRLEKSPVKARNIVADISFV